MSAGDDAREAYTAIAWGVLLSHEMECVAGAEAVETVERNMGDAVTRGVVRPAGVREHITCKRIASEPGRPRLARNR